MDFIEFYKKKLEPLLAILIVLFLVFALTGLAREYKIKQEIKENCGYQKTEEIYCVCDRNIVPQFKIQSNPYYTESELNNVLDN